jgi:carbonic anhydrase/acetyltransferase-like protein (isoleucine patch superfamily)
MSNIKQLIENLNQIENTMVEGKPIGHNYRFKGYLDNTEPVKKQKPGVLATDKQTDKLVGDGATEESAQLDEDMVAKLAREFAEFLQKKEVVDEVAKSSNFKGQDFLYVKSLIPSAVESEWHKHPNGFGWVKNTATVAETAYVGGKSLVSGNAHIYGNALVFGNARVYGNAKVFGNAQIYGDAEIYGQASVYDNAKVYDYAKVFDNAKVYGDTFITGDAYIYGNAMIYGNAYVYGYARVYGNAKVLDNAKVFGYSKIFDTIIDGDQEINNEDEVVDEVANNTDTDKIQAHKNAAKYHRNKEEDAQWQEMDSAAEKHGIAADAHEDAMMAYKNNFPDKHKLSAKAKQLSQQANS